MTMSSTRIPSGASAALTLSGRRTKSRAAWPARTTAATVCEPTKPVPPVISTRMAHTCTLVSGALAWASWALSTSLRTLPVAVSGKALVNSQRTGTL